MKAIKKIIKIFGIIIGVILVFLLVICIWHNISNVIENKKIAIPGDKIEIYENEYIHSVRMGSGEYTIVFLPGMGTASPYYDYYKLAKEVSKSNQVIIMEPFGYGFSDNISKERTLNNYEYELSKVLNYYNIKENIILLGHSYSGISNFNYASKHDDVKGIICLDCTTAYQIDTHVKDGKFIEEVPSTPKIYSLVSPLGISRFAYLTFMKSAKDELLIDTPLEYQKNYSHLLYNKTLNKTIINEIDDIYNNQLEIIYKKYDTDLYVLTILSDETVNNMKGYKQNGDFNQDWEEMHQLLISNNDIQKIYILHGNHYIHHGNVEEINNKINEMISKINNNNSVRNVDIL